MQKGRLRAVQASIYTLAGHICTYMFMHNVSLEVNMSVRFSARRSQQFRIAFFHRSYPLNFVEEFDVQHFPPLCFIRHISTLLFLIYWRTLTSPTIRPRANQTRYRFHRTTPSFPDQQHNSRRSSFYFQPLSKTTSLSSQCDLHPSFFFMQLTPKSNLLELLVVREISTDLQLTITQSNRYRKYEIYACVSGTQRGREKFRLKSWKQKKLQGCVCVCVQ